MAEQEYLQDFVLPQDASHLIGPLAAVKLFNIYPP